MTLKQLLPPLVTGGIIVILLLWVNWERDQRKAAEDRTYDAENGIRKAKEVNTIQNALLAASRDSVRLIQFQRSKDSTEHLKVTEGLQARNKAWSRKYADLKAEIKPIADSLPVVAEFQRASDSLLSVKDSIIMAEQRNALVQYKSFTSEIVQLHGQIEATDLKSEAWRVAAVDGDKKLKKETRKKKFFRTASIVLAGAVGVLLLAGK